MATQTMKRVAFTVDKNGRPRAYRWCFFGHRWFPMGYDAAKVAVATGAAEETRYTTVQREHAQAGR